VCTLFHECVKGKTDLLENLRIQAQNRPLTMEHMIQVDESDENTEGSDYESSEMDSENPENIAMN